MFITDEARLHYNISCKEFEKVKEEAMTDYNVILDASQITEEIKKISRVISS